ncbi:MAG: hypothetical protein AAFV53_12590 [Myxococcota bacterium]
MRMGWMILMGSMGCDEETVDTAAQETEPAAQEPDWAAELNGMYEGVEESPNIPTLVSNYEILYSEEADRFEISEAPQGKPLYLKLYFDTVVLDDGDENRATFNVPEQIYAEGQTGSTELILVGGGTIDRSEGIINLVGDITAFGGPQPFTFTFTPLDE